MARTQALHPHWTGFLILSEHDDTVMLEGIGSIGRFKRAGDILTIDWDDYSPDEFILVRNRFVHRQLVQSFPDLESLTTATIFEHPVEPTRISVFVPGHPYEVTLRLQSSDVPTFGQVFIWREYQSPHLPDTAETIVDLGANIGLASVFFGLRYPGARIFAVEPDRLNFALTCRNTKDLGSRITCQLAAAWTEDGSITLQTEDGAGTPLGNWGGRVSPANTPGASAVPSFRIDTLYDRAAMPEVDILKIDVEGAELDLFRGSPGLWLDRTKFVIIETHDRFRPGSEAAVHEALADHFVQLPSSGENLLFKRR